MHIVLRKHRRKQISYLEALATQIHTPKPREIRYVVVCQMDEFGGVLQAWNGITEGTIRQEEEENKIRVTESQTGLG